MMNNNFNTMLNQLRSNPAQFLLQKNLNIPQNISNDPNQIIQHLLNTGQITQQQYNQAALMAKQMMPK